MRLVPTPHDYFGETRTSLSLYPEKILCFTRGSRHEIHEPVTRHHHHRYVLVVPWESEGDVFVNDRRFHLARPGAMLIFPFQFHHGFQFHDARVLWQFVTFELKDGTPLESLRLDPVRALSTADFRLLSTLAETWNDPAHRDELADWLALILKRIIRAPSTQRIPDSEGYEESEGESLLPTQPAATSLLLRINSYCMTHLHTLFGLKEIAAHLSISESYLRARFRSETGLSLGQHLRTLRLQKAIGLLLQSDLSVGQVAERCGFDSIFAFSRSFRRFMGVSARDYRDRFISSGSVNRKS
ncbi:MAG: helix-turn-helix transcriptional regulator [Candidatus Methylacidiphilales bacterium]|nr:helix-turn-helix transcriptional regulator [Candidatus Methylacidiphilales bacterium]